MGIMKNIEIEIKENDANDNYLADKLGISYEELKQLTFEKKPNIDDPYSRIIIFDITKSPRIILAKIKHLQNGSFVNYCLKN